MQRWTFITSCAMPIGWKLFLQARSTRRAARDPPNPFYMMEPLERHSKSHRRKSSCMDEETGGIAEYNQRARGFLHSLLDVLTAPLRNLAR